MTMRYFKDPQMGDVYGYNDETQADWVAACVAAAWTGITGSWPCQ